MKIVAISDTHCHPLPEILKGRRGDLLIHAGDWTFQGRMKELRPIVEEIKEIKSNFSHIIGICGNHEVEVERDELRAEWFEEQTGVKLLFNEEIILNGLRIWGSPVTPRFGGWAYMKTRGEDIAKVWEDIPEGIDIAIIHGPPHGILDAIPSGMRVGCEDLKIRLDTMKDPPKYLIIGHLHGSYGQRVYRTPGGKVINCFNVSICTEEYRPNNPPTEIVI